MNISNLIHVACALAVQAVIGLLTDSWWAGRLLVHSYSSDANMPRPHTA